MVGGGNPSGGGSATHAAPAPIYTIVKMTKIYTQHVGFLTVSTNKATMKKLARTTKKNRLQQLEVLRGILAEEIDYRPGARDLASLVKQYRETLAEIEQLKGGDDNDEIDKILEARQADGKPGAVRKGGAGI